MSPRFSAVHVRVKSVRLESAKGLPDQFAAKLQHALGAQLTGRASDEVHDVAGQIAARVATHLDRLPDTKRGRGIDACDD